MRLLSRPFNLTSVSQCLCRQIPTVTRHKRRKVSVLAQKTEQTWKKQEPIPFQDEPLITRRPDPYILVAPDLKHLRSNLLKLLGSAHPGLTQIAEYYFLHPSKQLRSILVLLFSRATNGLGDHWARKSWEAGSEGHSGRSEELDRPLQSSETLNEWNPNMSDHTSSFDSPFELRRHNAESTIPTPPFPPTHLTMSLSTPPMLLPTQIRLAQIVEMIHVASLLHENILTTSDEAPSAASSSSSSENPFGNKLSILGGDFLLGRASTVLSRLGESEVVELIASVISNLVEGEFLRMDRIKTPRLGVSTGPKNPEDAWDLYLRKTYLKSASLMAKGARAAVILGGCRENEIWKEIAYSYGRNLGIAYQLIEDTLDYETCSSNLQPGLATGPALYAWEECRDIQPLIRRNFTNIGDIELAVEFVRRTSGIERTRLLAHAYAEKAREVLQILPDSDTKLALEGLTEIVVKRTW